MKMSKEPYGTRTGICVPAVDSIRKLILSEAHDTAYSIHPGSTKMYYDLKERFWWYGMKRSVAEYVAVCDTQSASQGEHRDLRDQAAVKDSGMEMGTDKHGFHCRLAEDSEEDMTLSDYPTKVAHFIPVRTTYPGAKLANLYISRIVRLHGVPKRIISTEVRSSHLVSGSELHDSLDTKLRFGTAYHPRTDGRTERTNRVLEDMLRACAIRYGSGWDKMLPYASSLTTIATKPA
ncbi:hypothetical protein U9M48_028405 [Paspalum notatum var. saurae]|uniref:Integrase zinc-binding domain-containing protein n=1 Tax=Paspalum notatum var. saurae TaxID=547442 RepID=A0AAQ3U180_PASNO